MNYKTNHLVPMNPLVSKSVLDEIFETSEFKPELQHEIIGKDTRRLIRDTTVAPFRYICQIAKSDRTQGTGFFIGPKTILTAGHVVWNKRRNRIRPKTDFTITPALNGIQKPFQPLRLNVVDIVMSKIGFSNADYSTRNDYAIIHIDISIGASIGYFGKGIWTNDNTGSSILSGSLPLPTGTLTANVCGYPTEKGGLHQYLAYNNTSILRNGILSYQNDTTGGMSGSPVWIRRSPDMGGRVIVGVHISGYDTPRTGNRSVFIDAGVRNFIHTNLR